MKKSRASKRDIKIKRASKNISEKEHIKRHSIPIREQCRAIFGSPPPPKDVWEPEFDYNNEALHAVAKKDWQKITSSDLYMYYLLNLNYVEPLQPEVFYYLFPLCLAVWYENGRAHDEFYRALLRPYLWETMMSERQGKLVKTFIVNTMLERLNQEFELHNIHAYSWMDELNNIACSVATIQAIWESWWASEDFGHTITALTYASTFIYDLPENPILKDCLQRFPHIELPVVPCKFTFANGWLAENLNFIKQTLTSQYIIKASTKFAATLSEEKEGILAATIAQDALERKEIIEIKIEAFLNVLEHPE